MTSLDEYIRSLEDLVENFEEEVAKIVLANSGNLLGTIKNRLFNKGLDGNLQSLGPYLDSTVKLKEAKGQRASFVTLRDTGAFYNGMFIDVTGSQITIDSTDSKTDELVSIYGEAILKLTDNELEIFIQSILEPAIEQLILRSLPKQIDI